VKFSAAQAVGGLILAAAIFAAGIFANPILRGEPPFSGGGGPAQDDNPVGYRGHSQGNLQVHVMRSPNRKTTQTTCNGKDSCYVFLDVNRYPRSRSQDCEDGDDQNQTTCPSPTCPPESVTCVTFEGPFYVQHVTHRGRRHKGEPMNVTGIFYVTEQ